VIKDIIAGSYSLLLHIVLLGLFVVGMESQSPTRFVAPPTVDIVQAKVMDESQIVEQMDILQQLEDKKIQQEHDRQAKVDEKLAETQQELARKEQEFLDQQQRAKIEQQQRDLKAKQEQEKINKLEQERKLEDKKRIKAEADRKLAEDKKQKAEQDRKAAEELQQKADAKRREAEQKQRLAEADRKAEEQRQRDAEEKARKAEADEKKRLAKIEADRKKAAAVKKKKQAEARDAEAKRLVQESLEAEFAKEAQERETTRVQGIVNLVVLQISQKVKRNWNRPGTVKGQQVTLHVKLMPGGDVKQVTVIKSSGDAIFDRSAETAVYKAAPLPQPKDPKAAAELRDFQFVFKPE